MGYRVFQRRYHELDPLGESVSCLGGCLGGCKDECGKSWSGDCALGSLTFHQVGSLPGSRDRSVDDRSREWLDDRGLILLCRWRNDCVLGSLAGGPAGCRPGLQTVCVCGWLVGGRELSWVDDRLCVCGFGLGCENGCLGSYQMS